jgi:hypothetical protein
MGETGETGEDFDLFQRPIPAFNRTELKFSLPFSHDRPEWRSNSNILTGLTGLTGLADPPFCQIEWLVSGQEISRSESTHYLRAG